jgi:hypothetical protein
MSYGLHDALEDVITDLRGHQPLLDLLDGDVSEVIDEGWPADSQREPVVVRVQPITETSGSRGAATERTFRMQFSVVATQRWREAQNSPTYRMAEIMAELAEQLDHGLAIDDVLPGETASGSWEDVEGGRVALLQDWRITAVTNHLQ